MEYSKQNNREFTADKPIPSLSKDEFGRQQYVESIAAALVNSADSDGLVLGISGPWGSGKTSLKNMIKDELQHHQDKENAVHVIEFDPWMYSGSNKLVCLMFSQISDKLSPRSNLLRRIGTKAFRILSRVVSAIRNSIRAQTLPSITVAGELVAEGFQRLSKALDPESDDIEKLAKRRDELSEMLSNFNGRIIVFIDDLDRLLDGEIVDMLRAVKAVGDLPQMTYVLLYDRGAVTKAVGSMYHDKGDEYLEKIIQVPIELPTPPQDVILMRLNSELIKIAGPEIQNVMSLGQEILFSHDSSVCNAYVVPFLQNPRDAIRLANEFRIRYAVLKDDVELTDLLGITSLEVFRPKLHHWILLNKELLYSPVARKEVLSRTEDPNDERSRQLQKELKDVKDPIEISALKSLFPFVESTVQGNWTTANIRDDDAHRFICQREHFDAYFRLSIDPGLYHEAAFRQLLLKDDLDGKNIDKRHLEIVKDCLFPNKAARYLGTAEPKRVAKVVGYCLQCDHLYYELDLEDSVSIKVATAILNIHSNSPGSPAHHEDLLKVIVHSVIQSDSPAVAPIAAWFAAQIFVQLNKAMPDSEKDTGLKNDAVNIQASQYEPLRIPIYRENQEVWESCLSDLKNKLMHLPQSEYPILFADDLLQLCTNAITLLFTSDEEIKQAFESLRPLVNANQFSLYVADALTEKVNGGYKVKLCLIEDLVSHEAYLEAISALVISGLVKNCLCWFEARKYIPQDLHAIAAYFATIKEPDIGSSVPREKTEKVIDDWEREINESNEYHG